MLTLSVQHATVFLKFFNVNNFTKIRLIQEKPQKFRNKFLECRETK